MVDQPFRVPILIVYALVNRPYMVDLQEDRSLVRNLLKLGLDVYLIDWGYPGRAIGGSPSTTTSTAISTTVWMWSANAMRRPDQHPQCLPRRHPEPLLRRAPPGQGEKPHHDGHAGRLSRERGLVNLWAGCDAGAQGLDIDALVDALGNIPGDFMNWAS